MNLEENWLAIVLFRNWFLKCRIKDVTNCITTISCGCVALLYCSNSIRHSAAPRCICRGTAVILLSLSKYQHFARAHQSSVKIFYFINRLKSPVN